MRPEIQALRGVAVALVVVFHLWPGALPGGFVGVDVFFVISGFLITGQLVREVGRTGTVSLAGFWARRARRILPAALVVLAAVAVATKLTVPETQWEGFFAEVSASALYVENWHLASAAVDYQALGDAPSPVQHFWSLSVEEQFYLVWPLLILAALLAGRRWIVPVLALVTVLSLAWSALRTGTDPARAYFVTPTRAWEFGVGGLLALVPLARPSRALTVGGLASIAVAAVVFGEGTAFPGVAALLPVLGAAAVIHARTLAWRPLERLGDVSYAVYLWHWPLIVLMAGTSRFVLLALTLALAALTKVLVEDPVRRLHARPRLTFAPAAAGTLAVLLLAASGTAALDERIERERVAVKRVLAHKPSCFGAAAVARRCRAPGGVVPAPVVAADAPNGPCHILEVSDRVVPCAFGARQAEAKATVALIGDSHASHWRAALDPVAERRGWRGISIARSHCPYAAGDPGLEGSDREGCLAWREQLPRWLSRHPEVTTLFVAQFTGADATADDYAGGWDALPESVERIIVLRDNPQMLSEGKTLACVERHEEEAATRCARRRDAALQPDPAAQAARTHPRATLVDLTRFFCDARTCSPVIGGALVHKDANHLTSVYAATLAPYLGRAVDGALGV